MVLPKSLPDVPGRRGKGSSAGPPAAFPPPGYDGFVEERPAGRPRFSIQASWKDGIFLALAGGWIALDQLTKWLIRLYVDRGESIPESGLIRIVHYLNSGAAFGMFQGAGPLLALTSVIGMVAIGVFLFNPGFAHPLMRIGLALMLGGAVGNLIDRVRTGEVVDFIKVPNFPAFNVADSGITVGVMLLLWTMLTDARESPAPSSSGS